MNEFTITTEPIGDGYAVATTTLPDGETITMKGISTVAAAKALCDRLGWHLSENDYEDDPNVFRAWTEADAPTEVSQPVTKTRAFVRGLITVVVILGLALLIGYFKRMLP